MSWTLTPMEIRERGLIPISNLQSLTRIHRLPQPADVADGVQAAKGRITRALVAVALDRRDVVRAQDALETDVFVGLHARQHVGLARVVPGLFELLRRAAHVAEVHEEDLALLAKAADHAGQIVEIGRA